MLRTATAPSRHTLALLAALLLALAGSLLVVPAPVAHAADSYPLSIGDTGWRVTEVQRRLRWVGLSGEWPSGTYTSSTARSVKRFQEKNRLAITGVANSATVLKLRSVSYREGVLPTPCRTGKVICIDKTQRILRFLIDGDLQIGMDARFGASGTPTREGTFKIYKKSRNHVSGLYGSSMPFSMFFSGGQAIHYSYAFVADGYDGGSHGCVNTRSWSKMERLYDATWIGRKVYIYR